MLNSKLSTLNFKIMALIKSYKGMSPKWGKDCYFSENATIVGDVTIGDECSIWFNAVVRGDVAPITIGNCSNVQDGSCVHVTHETGPTHIGNYVTIGHNVTVHACTIHDHALIGMGSTLLDGCEIGEGAIVAAGALVLQHTKIPPHEIWGGVPAKYLSLSVLVRRIMPSIMWNMPRLSWKRILNVVSDFFYRKIPKLS